MPPLSRKAPSASLAVPRYVLAKQVGFVLRQALQRHVSIFNEIMAEDLTPPQWAVLSQLYETGGCSQNLLGRQTSMDVATIKGVVDRLIKRKLVASRRDPIDGRRIIVTLTDRGSAFTRNLIPKAEAVTKATLKPLSEDEAQILVALLRRLR